MTTFFLLIGRLVFYAAWPFWRWYFPRHPRTRLLVVVGDEVLLLRGWLGDGTWSLPGGGLHRGEDPQAAVLREAKEEVGMNADVSQLVHLGEFTLSEKAITTTYIAFAVMLDSKFEPNLQWHEIAEAKWLQIDDAEVANLASATREVLVRWRKRTKTATI
jgi:8-oxo-dGTP pyrophosphatase MutT (NUDIX family)